MVSYLLYYDDELYNYKYKVPKLIYIMNYINNIKFHNQFIHSMIHEY